MRMAEIKEAILDMLQFIFKPVTVYNLWEWLSAEHKGITLRAVEVALSELIYKNEILQFFGRDRIPVYILRKINIDKKDKYVIYKKNK